ncbi:uncharacterized protein LOC132555603 [Ylistrum balloti]|uniref:uncharacterized protein LOC132555603 n=1 Tax=Ylistrum balloti TaxID=509963 RepID=UPI002905E617|nr:uncharacterized protein LOC132555603 [Ylistrum balloti]
MAQMMSTYINTTFEVKTKYVDIEKERDEARSHCQGNFYQGDLARLEDITNSRQGSIRVWDGNVYKLSPPITIKGCTNDTGLTKHKIPRMKLWKDAAAQCQALCNTSTFAIRDTDCHCLSDSITPADDSHCLPMLARTPAQNSKNTEAKTVFQTVTLEISDVPALNKCIAANGLNPCNFELRNCQDRLQMECKLGTSARTVWAEAAYGCNSAKSFPSPVRDNCPPDSSVWFGGFRDLQYSPGNM